LHPRDRFIPWWGRRAQPRNIQNITYVNRTYITVVNHNTFVSSRNVTNNIVRDSVIVREANSVRVMEQPLPIPNRSSLRVRDERENRRFQRPPTTIGSRPAVVRTAPVPPPPTFQEKLPEIQKTQGEPLAPDKAQAMGLAKLKSSNRRNLVRPAAVESGRGDFAPRTPGGSAPVAQPLTAPRGKKLATPEEPVITNVPERLERSEPPAAKSDQKVVVPSVPAKGAVRPPQVEQRQDRGPQNRGTPIQDQQQLREKQKGQGLQRQKLQDQGYQSRQEPPQEPQGKEQPQVPKGQQPEAQKARDLKLQEHERQKQEKQLQRQPKEAPQVPKEEQRVEQKRDQPQKQERDLHQKQAQQPQRKEPPPLRKGPPWQQQKHQTEEQKEGATAEPGASSPATR
jgi:hypothetical protein